MKLLCKKIMLFSMLWQLRNEATAGNLGVSQSSSDLNMLSINVVPSISSVHETEFSTDPTVLRTQLAMSYMHSAHRFLHIGDNTKAIACYAASRGWLRGCTPSSTGFGRCIVLAINTLLNLGELIFGIDRMAACCAGREVLTWSRGHPPIWQQSRDSLIHLKLWHSCPSLNQMTPQNTESYDQLKCKPLALAMNAESIISSVDYSQSDLFENRTDVPYRSAAKDLRLTPIFRFTPEQWDYGIGDAQLIKRIEEPMRVYIERRNLSLGFTEMFHSCIPLGQIHTTVFPSSNPKPTLFCAWRRHMELLSMVSAIFVSTLDMNRLRPGKVDLPKSRPKLLVTGEDPRLFRFRGKFFFSMQRVTDEVGHRYSDASAEQVFRNYLVEVDTGRTILLKKPAQGDPYVCRWETILLLFSLVF